MHIEAGWRYADLAAVAILVGGKLRGDLPRIDIVEHDHRRVAAKLHGGALHVLAGQCGELLADRNRAGEGDLSDLGSRNEMGRNGRRISEDQIERACGDPGLEKSAHNLADGAR